MAPYAYVRDVPFSVDQVLKKLPQILERNGLAILNTIDVDTMIHDKLGLDLGRYVIVGVCNHFNAHKALSIEETIGLVLPCNMIIYEKDNHTKVGTIRPTMTLGLANNDNLREIALFLDRKLRDSVDMLG
jgi:uncharacterized protein (DUF302 family)